MRTAFIFTILLLGACAHSTEGIRQEQANRTYMSQKAPAEIAECLQRQISGLDVELAGTSFSVSKRNQFGAVLLNWFIRPLASGSEIELRKTNSIAGGETSAERCF